MKFQFGDSAAPTDYTDILLAMYSEVEAMKQILNTSNVSANPVVCLVSQIVPGVAKTIRNTMTQKKEDEVLAGTAVVAAGIVLGAGKKVDDDFRKQLQIAAHVVNVDYLPTVGELPSKADVMAEYQKLQQAKTLGLPAKLQLDGEYDWDGIIEGDEIVQAILHGLAIRLLGNGRP